MKIIVLFAVAFVLGQVEAVGKRAHKYAPAPPKYAPAPLVRNRRNNEAWDLSEEDGLYGEPRRFAPKFSPKSIDGAHLAKVTEKRNRREAWDYYDYDHLMPNAYGQQAQYKNSDHEEFLTPREKRATVATTLPLETGSDSGSSVSVGRDSGEEANVIAKLIDAVMQEVAGEARPAAG